MICPVLSVIKFCCMHLVAEKCLSNIETVLQNELEIVSEWLVDNKLFLHLGKTESILFGSRPRLKSQSVFSITCKGTVIEANNTVKYLGVVLEQCHGDFCNSKGKFHG